MEIRIRLPDRLSSWKHYLRNPSWFIVGRYDFKKFVAQRDLMMHWRSRALAAEEKQRDIREKLVKVSKELTALKKATQEKK
jgi:hypothetical protein